VLGYLVLSADTLGEALAQFERFQQLLYGGSPGETAFTGNEMRFVWPVHDHTLGVGLSDETLVFGLINFVRIMLGAQVDDTSFRSWLKDVRITFVHNPTAGLETYQASGVGDIRFRQPALSISLPVSVLTLPVSNRDPALFQLLNQQAEALLKVLPDGPDGFDEQVRDYLRRALPEGTPTLEKLAAAVNMSARTVHRRLEERGLNFRTLLQQTRIQLARQYLDEGRISLGEIALMLGYSEQSAFTRAFRTWTGMSPKQYQRS
jgi:AraC-like DNA-binding protein